MEREQNEKLGTIKISEDVVLTCAAKAVLKTEGVAYLWGGITDTITKNILGKDPTGKGLKLATEEDCYVLDVYVVVDYEVRIPEVAWNIQENVKNAIEKMTEIKVKAVNIHIQDVHFPEGEDK